MNKSISSRHFDKRLETSSDEHEAIQLKEEKEQLANAETGVDRFEPEFDGDYENQSWVQMHLFEDASGY